MTDGTAIETVRAALAAGQAPDKRSLELALREGLGLSARQARRLLSQGYAGLGAVDASDDADLLAAIERARDRLIEVLHPSGPSG